MQTEILHILNNHGQASANPSMRSSIGNYMRHTVINAILRDASIDRQRYKVWGSVGQTNWAEIPWICIADKSVTNTAQRGYYIVYLFKEDMSGVYLSLNQGWTFFQEAYGTKMARDKVRTVAIAWRSMLASYGEEFTLPNINLGCKGKLGKGYELGHICGKYYPIEQLPDDLILVNDLRAIMGVYKELKGHFGRHSVDEFTKELASGSIFKSITDDEIDEQFNKVVSKTTPSQTPEEPQQIQAAFNSGGKLTWARNPEKSSEALDLAQHKCEIDPSHMTFVAYTTGENFVEAHHLIPMRAQGQFKYSLDVPGNIISLCPNCHRAIHHATKEVKTVLISKIYEQRRDRLIKYGIPIDLEVLLKV